MYRYRVHGTGFVLYLDYGGVNGYGRYLNFSRQERPFGRTIDFLRRRECSHDRNNGTLACEAKALEHPWVQLPKDLPRF
jgi:hypothetical protein